ncbi:MAG: hypothetical protein ACQESR_24385 [Planctomycetota bacterium]
MTPRRKRIMITVLALAVVFWTQFGMPWIGSTIRVSPETTRITGPLDEEGYVDYVAALNRMASRDTTPENNAAVLVAQALGPGSSKVGSRHDDFFAKLGIAKPPSDGDYFVSSDEFVARRDSADAAASKEAKRRRWQDLRAAMVQPWRANEHPWLAEWLKENEGPLGLFVKASRRSCWFAPLRQDVMLLGQTSLASDLREPGRALCARAMLRLANRDLEGASDDAIACRRLGRLVRQQPLVMSMLIGSSLETTGIQATAALVHFARPPAKILDRLGKTTNGLPPPQSLVQLLDIGERFVQLDSRMAAARGEIGQPINIIQEVAMRRGLDWNIILRQANDAMDQLVDAAKTEDPAARIRALRQRHQKIDNHLEQRTKGWKAVLSMLYRSGRSRFLGDMLTSIQLPEAHILASSLNRTEILLELARIMPAIGDYRAEHDEYPETLKTLVPNYLDVLPEDPYTDGPYRYRRTEAGCLIYSAGANGRDDKGRNQALEPGDTVPDEADDVFLRLPPRVP